VLEARDVQVSFGGVRAVDGVDLTVADGEIHGLVGPNGSGKSTFINALTGVVPASGHVVVDGEPLTLGRPAAATRRGILRTFQTPQTVLSLTCMENVLLATADRRNTGVLAAWFARPAMWRSERERWARAVAALERVGLGGVAEHSAAPLSYGRRRLLEIAAVIAGDPRLILLDEPAAGLNAAETEQLATHLASLRDEGRHIFATLDVEENLHVGQAARSGRPVTFSIDDAYDLFPALRPLRHRAGWALSGGEQQMLAVARALVGSPRLLLLDEPSLGLAPLVARTVFDALLEVRDRVPLLVVEQNTDLALRICTRVHVLSEGRTVLAGAPDELGDRSALLASYLGQGGTPVAEHLAPEQP